MTSDVLQRQAIEDNELFDEVIRSAMLKLDSSMIGIVTQFNEDLNTVDVQPVIMRKMRGQSPRPLSIIKNCPIKYYGAGGFVITFKPEVGDICDLSINDRSLDVWKTTGGIVDSGMARHHDMTDAKAYFGLNNYSNAYESLRDGMDIRTRDGTTSFLVKNGSVEVTIGGVLVATMSSSSVAFNVPITGPSATFGGVVVESHTHSGVQPGSGNSGGPVV